ncbi:MAG TPA: SAM-dependent chlorinase/fluorinase [Cytophagaceae bacterium]|jgi:S-adenosylmethionine hydrolase|nr:SAM-dependent chlorinase/fluorinase [Cytophagaceae bacterium]
MAIITFMSDFGHRDHYVAAVKAKILSFSHNLKIVDITHQIDPFNIMHGAYVLRSVFRDFPKGTVHLISVNNPTGDDDRLLAMKQEDHFFVGSDNGLFSLLSEKISVVVELKKDITNNNFHPSFPEKTTLAAAAAALANEVSIYNLGPQVSNIKTMLNRQLRTSKDQILGCVIHVDNCGNLITNITKEVFHEIGDNRSFTISFSRDQLDFIATNYHSVENGDSLAIFNSSGLLEICMRQGKASQLLGMDFESPVNILFS